MDNMGGLRKLYYLDADNFVSLTPYDFNIAISDPNTIVDLNEIEFTEGTGKINETEEETDNGLMYNFDVTCRIPKCGPENSDLFGELRKKKLLFVCEDNNDRYWLTGAPGSFFNIVVNSNTGVEVQEPNARQLKISAALINQSVFIESPFQ